jgi:hypothetical protein
MCILVYIRIVKSRDLQLLCMLGSFYNIITVAVIVCWFLLSVETIPI